MTIKAVIYDVDGTLVNSEPLHVASWDEALESYGYHLSDLPDVFIGTMAGKKPIAIATDMMAQLDIDDVPQALLKTKTEKYLKLVDHDLEAMAGAVNSIMSLRRSGYRLAIGTSVDQLLLDKMLRKLDIQDTFEVIVTGDQITKGKPDPETYLTVAEKLNLRPSECCVIEDTETGIRSAKASGAYCIAIENPDAIKQDTSGADMTLSSLYQLTSVLIGLVAAGANPD